MTFLLIRITLSKKIILKLSKIIKSTLLLYLRKL